MKTTRFALLLAALGFGCGGAFAAPITGVSAISGGGYDGYTQDYDHSCAIKAGDVLCWGYNANGQLGNGTTTSSILPVPVTGLSGIAAIASGGTNTCAITGTGSVKCWGAGATTPVDVTGIPAGVTVLAAGVGHTCALSTGGVLTCWGDNTQSQLGDGTIGTGIVAIAAGEYHTCAVTGAGALKCWGLNNAGQLGDGTYTNSAAPRDVQGLSSGVIAVSAGNNHTCALSTGGTVKCWGHLTTFTSPYSANTPQDVNGFGNPVTVLSSAGYHNCALTTAGNVKCWGNNTRGQLGYDFHGFTLAPGPDVIGLSSGVTSVVAGGNHSCAIIAAGGVKCWGLLSVATQGPGNMFNAPYLPTPVTIGLLPQMITFGAMANRDRTASPVTLDATTSSGLAAEYSSQTPNACSVSGTTLTLLSSGVCLLTASQPGDIDYDPAAPIKRGFLITDAVAAATPRLANISSRGRVLTGNDVMIAGFIVGGSNPKTVAVTVAGPSLFTVDVANRLMNPTLTLVRQSDGVVIATNDDFRTQTNPIDLDALFAAGLQPNNDFEPAIIATLPPGAYTAIVQGVGGTTGIALVGVYEVDHPEVPLSNISTRAQVQNGDNVLIAGFIVQGNNPKDVVVTVAGPSLGNAGIPNPLSNPMVTVVRQSDGVVIASNDDWQAQANPGDVAKIQNAGFSVAHPLESAVYLTLPPGAYTAIVQGVGGRVGVGLVGVYVAP
ncbi:RCC1 domain-containing protein [Usitatibacter palustris]|uniref:Alpha-tubulin suppressor n=1 Tax=Usitatibacter palustris TaxID=2732487 RepID=A0A6M4HD95_9PROT|nr:hypothetical protein [Usitatibacter palustris]QJR16524.1 hypothetical protein DSM104440_03359 [Usitatibacter palustris]